MCVVYICKFRKDRLDLSVDTTKIYNLVFNSEKLIFTQGVLNSFPKNILSF